MVHVIAFTNKFRTVINFNTNKEFYKTGHPGRVSGMTSFGFIRNKVWDNIHNR